MFFADTGAIPASGVLTYGSTFRAPSLDSLGLGENHRTPWENLGKPGETWEDRELGLTGWGGVTRVRGSLLTALHQL